MNGSKLGNALGCLACLATWSFFAWLRPDFFLDFFAVADPITDSH